MALRTLYDEDGNPIQVDLEDEPSSTDKTDSGWAKIRRDAKEAKERADKAEAALAVRERTDAFREAGIDPSDPRLSYFVKGYDGKMEGDAIKAAAVAAGFVAAPAATEGRTLTAEEQSSLAAAKAISSAGTGAGPENVTGTAALDRAVETGGLPGLLEAAARMGIPIVHDGQ